MATISEPSCKKHPVETTTNLKMGIWPTIKDECAISLIPTVIHQLQSSSPPIKG